MFCIYCGKQIPEGTECDCRKQVYSNAPVPSPSAPAAPASDTDPYYNYNYYRNPQNPGFANPYQDSKPRVSAEHQAIKDVFRSPLMLITCLLFSADFVLGLLDGFSMDIFLLLSAVGLWLVYAFSHRAEAPLKTVGLKFHSVILMIQRVFLISLYAIISILIISLAFIPDEFNEFMYDMKLYMSIYYNWNFDYNFSFTSIVFSILLAVWTCFFLFVLFYNIKMKNNVKLLSETAKGAETRRSFSVFPGVVLIMQFLCSAGSLVTYIMTAETRNRFLNSFLNSLMRQLEESYDIKINYAFNLTTNYLSIARMAVSAAALLFAAITVFSLKAKLNRAKEN